MHVATFVGIFFCLFSLFISPCCAKDFNFMTTPELISYWGYKAENYTVKTEDGYMLTVHRIANPNSSYPPVLIQHGLMLASDVWLLRGPQQDLALLLANAGFDVWLANTRGNVYSKGHAYLKYAQKKYWDFGWHEVGIYDIPAMVNLVLKITGRPKLVHFGHSMGTTSFYVMTSKRPEYNDKIHAHISLAPVAYMNHMKSLAVLNPVLQMRKQLVTLQDILRMYAIFSRNPGVPALIHRICNSQKNKGLCLNIIFLFIGIDYTQVNKEYLFDRYVGHFPSGGSARMLIHYAQNIVSGDFKEFDFGDKLNMAKYGSTYAPHYNLTNIRTPIYLYYSTNDYLSHHMDVDKLASELRCVKKKYLVPYENFNHMDYIWAKDAKYYLYDNILNVVKSFKQGD